MNAISAALDGLGKAGLATVEELLRQGLRV